ncbi:MAG: 5-(carboxyamino)imidazole ribonucleotide synthase [Synechococcaceae cyanobacterium]|nr:5-(carboxyamino)imidazole ribonucleotide synthase [Synechococcaceae cyanobacterium]
MEPEPATARSKPRRSARPPAIGIVGGGQLAWMLARAAARLGVDLHVQTPSPGDPAVALATSVVEAPLDDVAATRRLAERCRAISFENEWVPLEPLMALREEGITFLPDLDALRPLVSKRAQRQLLNRLHLPCPRWCALEAVLPPPPAPAGASGEGEGPFAQETAAPPPAPAAPVPAPPALPPGFTFPVMAKAATGGYDGRGTVPLGGQEDLEALLERVDPAAWILEEQVTFERELALVACRDRGGRVACFPLVETHQHHQVCDWVLFPAPVDQGVQAFARNVAASLLTALDYVGVLSIEFFYGPGGLQVNELAPRTHNSGHLTIEACACSQFEQQVRIVAGLPMGSTDPVLPGALMVNLLGHDHGEEDPAERLRALAALPGAHLHWYGKRGSSPGRKLGHLTLGLEGATPPLRAAERERRLAEVRRIWPLPAQSPP